MEGIWRAAKEGDLAEVERLVGQDPGLLNAGDRDGLTPLMHAATGAHVGVVRWLLDKGAATNKRDKNAVTALGLASGFGRSPVVELLLERGANPTIAGEGGWTPLIAASSRGHLEVVRLLLGHLSAKATLNHGDCNGKTALWQACSMGHGAVARALLESGADPTIAHSDGTTPMAIAKQPPPIPHDPQSFISAAGRLECVAALEVRPMLRFFLRQQTVAMWGFVFGHGGWQEAERAYQTSCGRPGRWPTSRGAKRWRWEGGGRRGGRCWTMWFTG
jgi:ankyrin repeat protein